MSSFSTTTNSSSNRRNTINPMTIDITTMSRKRPAGPLALNNIKRPHRLSLSMDRLQLNTIYSEAIGPQRTIADDVSIDTTHQASRAIYQPSLFAPQNTTRTSSFVRTTNQTLQEKILRKFNSHEKPVPRRVATDIRYIKEVDTQRKHLKGVTDYLQESGYAGVAPPRNIRALGAKDFQSMFKYLVEKIMPHHTYKKKFEDEVMDIIRELQYPLIDSISPKALLAVGALHSNPAFFALLYWLMRLCRARDELIKLQQKEKEMPMAESIASGKLFQNYCVHSYQNLLSGNLNFEPQTKLLESNFDEVGEEIRIKRKQLSERAQVLQKEYDISTEHEPPLQLLKHKFDELTNDKAKFVKLGEDKQARIAKYIDQNARVQREIDRMQGTRNLMESRRNIIIDQWRARNTSLEEIEAVEEIHRKVVQELTEESTKLDELIRSINEMEAKTSKTKSEVETFIQEYNNKLSVIPSSNEMKIVYNEHGKDLKEILNVDMDHDIIPHLEKFEMDLKKENVSVTEINLRQREQLNQLKSKVEEQSIQLKSDKERIVVQRQEFKEAHLKAQEENKNYNTVRDNHENARKERKEKAQQASLDAKTYSAKQQTLLKTVSQEIEVENNEMEIRIENTQKEVLTSLQNMSLTASNLKREVEQSNDILEKFT